MSEAGRRAGEPMDSSRGLWAQILKESAKFVVGLVVLVLLMALVGVVVQRYVDIAAVRAFIESFGALAPIMAVALLTLYTLLPHPLLPWPAIIGAASVTFGNPHGPLYVWLGASLGACLSFPIGRRFFSVRLSRLKRTRLQQFDAAASAHGLLGTMAVRFLLYSNVLMNYGSAVTSLRFRDYALGTLLGLVPRTFLVAYLFDSINEPDVIGAQLTYPFLSLHLVLFASKIVAIVILAVLTRQAYLATKTPVTEPGL